MTANTDFPRFHTKKTSPLTNIELSSLDLRFDAQPKQKIDAYVEGKDICDAQPATKMQTVTIKSPLNSWTMELPYSLTLKDLYALAFRLTKGRYAEFELRHKNAALPHSSLQVLGMSVTPAIDVFITPLESTTSSSNARPGEMCLIKVYTSRNYLAPVCSYWESKSATKTLASVVFRYYRQMFSAYAYTAVRDPFTIWHNLHSIGDNQTRGRTTVHWNALSRFFNTQNATGSVYAETMIDASDLSENFRAPSAARPLVLKLSLGSEPLPPARQRKTLSRLDVLKQMFDAFVNRLLAYNFAEYYTRCRKFPSSAEQHGRRRGYCNLRQYRASDGSAAAICFEVS